MAVKINKAQDFIEIIGHYDDKVQCAKMTLLADLYAVEHKSGYAKFPIEFADKIELVDKKLEFKNKTWKINVNGVSTTVGSVPDVIDGIFNDVISAAGPTSDFSISSGKVLYQGNQLQYNGADVLGSDTIHENSNYTTVAPQHIETKNIKVGTSNVNIKVGNTQVSKVYKGSSLIWEHSQQPSGFTLTVDKSSYCGVGNSTIIQINDGEQYEFSPNETYPIIFENVVKVKCVQAYSSFTIDTPEVHPISIGEEYTLTDNSTALVFDSSCLAPNTLVFTDNGYKEIKDINVDTMLLTYNSETQQNEYKKVIKWWHHPSTDLVIINDNLFTMTGDHPIYINDYEVVKGREVKVGDYLIDKDGNKVLVEKVEFSNNEIEVYMVEVEDNHNFYITDKNLLSHNY